MAMSRPRRVAPRLALLVLSAPPPFSRTILFARALSSSRSRGARGGVASRSASASSSLGAVADPFRTIIPIDPRPGKRLLTYSDSLFFVGSCFSDNVGGLAASAKFSVLRNPFGVQYNGSSVARCLRRIADGEPYRPDELGRHPTSGLWHSLDHHSRYNGPDRDRVLDAINSDLFAAREFLVECNQAYVTLGSAFVFDAIDPTYHPKPMEAVANCHKLPAKSFERRLQSVDEIRDALVSCHRSLADLSSDGGGLTVTFTVSPVRHWKDGPVNNARSKAHLLAAAHEAVEVINDTERLRVRRRSTSDGQEEDGSSPHTGGNSAGNAAIADYFPSYEILMDELRDYRFYDDDMLHPSRLAVEYIWDRLLDAHFDRKGGVDDAMGRATGVGRAMAHRPFDAEGEAYRDFLVRQLEEMDRLEREFPKVSFAEEREEAKKRLGR